jgi:pyruvate formate lyase activating enzyme
VDACASGALSLESGGVAFDPARCTLSGACVDACPAEARRWVGRSYDVAGLVAEIENDRLFHEQSDGGVTCTGGEPLQQWRFLCAILDACSERGIHRAVDTSGFASPDVLGRVAERTDLFLFDLKTLDATRHEEVTGVPLRPILDNLARLLAAGARVRIRMPLIPGINDDDASMERAADFLAGLREHRTLEGIDLLPYHSLAREKHARFDLPWRLENDAAIPDRRLEEIRARLESHGLRVTLGG